MRKKNLIFHNQSGIKKKMTSIKLFRCIFVLYSETRNTSYAIKDSLLSYLNFERMCEFQLSGIRGSVQLLGINTVSRASYGFYRAISKHERLCDVICDDLATITAFAIGIRCHPACFFKDL